MVYMLRLGDSVSVRHHRHRVLFTYWPLLVFYPLTLLWCSLLMWNLIEHTQMKGLYFRCQLFLRSSVNPVFVIVHLQFKFFISSCLTSSCSSFSSLIHFSFKCLYLFLMFYWFTNLAYYYCQHL